MLSLHSNLTDEQHTHAHNLNWVVEQKQHFLTDMILYENVINLKIEN